MGAEAAVFVRVWKVGDRSCRMTLPKPTVGRAVQVAVEWAPDQPTRLSAAELVEYRAGRDAAIAEVAQTLGITVGVVDL